MNSIFIAGIIFGCAFGGALLGIFLRAVLPEPHLDKDSKEVIRMGTGLVASMAALVLGLLVASATSAFNEQKSGFQEIAANVLLLDRQLSQFGPDGKPAREALRSALAVMIDKI